MKTTLQPEPKVNSPRARSSPAPASTFTSARNTFVQRQCACGGSSDSKTGCDECHNKRLAMQRQSAGHAEPSSVPPIVHEVLRSSGQPLQAQTRSFMEPRFGHDFSQVRVHEGAQAAESARAVNALAYTVGQHIVFGDGQYAPTTAVGQKQLAHELAHTVQQSKGISYSKEGISNPSDPHEQEAERIAEQVMSTPESQLSRSRVPPAANPPGRSRESSEGEAPEGEAEPAASNSAPESETAPGEPLAQEETPSEAAPSGLIVDDDTEKLGPGQMKKSDFLAQLKSSVCEAADSILAGAGQSTNGCPYIEYWFGYYANRDSASIERAIRRYAPEASGVASSTEYIPILTERVSSAVAVWAKTGQVTGVPEDTPASGPSAAAAQGAGGAESKTADACSKDQSGVSGAANTQSGFRVRLGAGEALDGSVRSRMESAFGHDFSDVRIYRNEQAAAMTSGLDARAFTVGSDIAFGGGEYKPGTPVGDAIIAHELAHVVQQRGADPSSQVTDGNANGYAALEEDADESAKGAMAAMWSRTKGGLGNLSRNAMPRLRSGLSLQRCGRKKCKLKSGPTYSPSGTITATASGGMKTAVFNMSAEFENDPANGIAASCCEARQFILWTVGPEPQTGAFTPASDFSPNTVYEDRDPKGKRYGHRSGSHAECVSINHYEDSAGANDCTNGVKFVGQDTPTGASTRTGQWQFTLKVIDTCQGDADVGTAATVNVQW